MTRITKDMLIGEIMNVDINLVNVLMGAGMYCITCPASQMESLEEACWVHGIDSDDMADALNEYLEAKEEGGEEAAEETLQSAPNPASMFWA